MVNFIIIVSSRSRLLYLDPFSILKSLTVDEKSGSSSSSGGGG